ncbi:hypothetical protein K438DRAFT_1859345 [Mycena galopus ATCC 62051]|nr:hypothetical protein K438DRAFT_1859345 [Mycena galopus ATCC 62051]
MLLSLIDISSPFYIASSLIPSSCRKNRIAAPDLGPDGIHSFFQRHRCGRFCQSGWTRPKIVGRAVFPMRQGSTMGNPNQSPTRASRNPLTRVQTQE